MRHPGRPRGWAAHARSAACAADDRVHPSEASGEIRARVGVALGPIAQPELRCDLSHLRAEEQRQRDHADRPAAECLRVAAPELERRAVCQVSGDASTDSARVDGSSCAAHAATCLTRSAVSRRVGGGRGGSGDLMARTSEAGSAAGECFSGALGCSAGGVRRGGTRRGHSSPGGQSPA